MMNRNPLDYERTAPDPEADRLWDEVKAKLERYEDKEPERQVLRMIREGVPK